MSLCSSYQTTQWEPPQAQGLGQVYVAPIQPQIPPTQHPATFPGQPFQPQWIAPNPTPVPTPVGVNPNYSTYPGYTPPPMGAPIQSTSQSLPVGWGE